MTSDDGRNYGSTIALAFMTKAGAMNPRLPAGENTAKDIAAVYIEEGVEDGRMAWRVHALHNIGRDELSDICVITVKKRKEAYDHASQLAHENDRLRKLSSDPYIVVDPDRVKNIGKNKSDTKIRVNMMASNGEKGVDITCPVHNKQSIAEFVQAYKDSKVDKELLPKVPVTKGNLVEAEFGQKKYQKEAPPNGQRADVTPIDIFDLD